MEIGFNGTELLLCKMYLNKSNDRKFNILLLTASSGGGHIAVSEAISVLLYQYLGGRAKISSVNIYQKGIVRIFPFLSKIRAKSDVAWAIFLYLTDQILIVKIISKLFRPIFLKRILSYIKEKPDIIIATHYAAGQYIENISRFFITCPRTVIIAIDYDPHFCWIAKSDLLIVASKKGVNKALFAGIPEKSLFSIPILPTTIDYVNNVCKKNNKLTIMICSGIDGTSEKRVVMLLKQINKLDISSKIKIELVCGKNRKLKKNIIDLAGIFLKKLDINIHGVIPGLPMLLKTVDLSVLRAGPQSISESLSAGVPVIAFDWHVHERGNLNLLTENKCGWFSKDTKKVVCKIEELYENPSILEQWRIAAINFVSEWKKEYFIEKILGS